MAFVRVNPGDPIQAQNLDQVIDALSGAATKGQPIALTALNDATNYAETIQNLEATNSRALNVLKSDGTTLIKADASGVTLGSPLNLPTNSITSTYIADGTIQNVDLGPDVARTSLLTNGGFEIWQRGNGPFTGSAYSADRWLVYAPAGTTSVSRDTGNGDGVGSDCAAVTTTAPHPTAGNGIYQVIDCNTDWKELRNRQVTISVRVKCSQANSVRVGLEGDKAIAGPSVYSAHHSGGGAYETLTATITLGVVNGITVWITGKVAGTWYVDHAMLVVGSQAANYVPLHPADDLARCLRYYEKMTLSARFLMYAGGTLELVVPMKAMKAISPTVTITPGSRANVAGGYPASRYVGADAVVFSYQGTANSDTYALNDVYVLEANP